MSNLISPEPPQHFLQLVKRLYDKRDEVLKSSQKLLEYAQKLEDCSNTELKGLLTEIRKEMSQIIANVHELAPHLKNSQISASISEQVRIIGLEMEELSSKSHTLTPVFKYRVATMLRNSICQDANKTQLNPTPKSIKQAFGVVVSPRDVNIKLFYEHQKDNY
jgi:DNA-directed RNA polymerase subunit F